MIEYIEGDIFDSPAQVIVNTVNTVGVMGKGLALSFKNRYPDMFERYKRVCEEGKLQIGNLMLFYYPDHWLMLFPTKENWRNPSKLEYIEKGLQKFVNTYADKRINSIAFPKLGCGNGDLDWNDVKPLMEKYLKNLPITIYIYLGSGKEQAPEHKVIKDTMKWLRENAKDMSFNGLCDDIRSRCAIMPIEFKWHDKSVKAYFQDKLLLESDDSSFEIESDELYQLWDDIRQMCVFPDSDEPRISEVYCLLCHIGYLSRIEIYVGKNNGMVSGYQLKGGLGKVYSLKEA